MGCIRNILWRIRCQPRGFRYPICIRILVPQNHALNGFWDQSPYILGTWTLWPTVSAIAVIFGPSAVPLWVGHGSSGKGLLHTSQRDLPSSPHMFKMHYHDEHELESFVSPYRDRGPVMSRRTVVAVSTPVMRLTLFMLTIIQRLFRSVMIQANMMPAQLLLLCCCW